MTSGTNRVLIQVQTSLDWSVLQNQPKPSPAQIWTKYVSTKKKKNKDKKLEYTSSTYCVTDHTHLFVHHFP